MRVGATWHTRYFRSIEEVEFIFGRTFTGDQQEAIMTYLVTGVRPDPGGCWTCDAAAMRKLTAAIDRYENGVADGSQPWPWNSDGTYELA